MKRRALPALLALALFAVTPACVTQLDPADEPAEPALSDTEQLSCHPALEGCIATATRDGNKWLIPTCYEVLCAD
jgi:hypothetical protein